MTFHWWDCNLALLGISPAPDSLVSTSRFQVMLFSPAHIFPPGWVPWCDPDLTCSLPSLNHSVSVPGLPLSAVACSMEDPRDHFFPFKHAFSCYYSNVPKLASWGYLMPGPPLPGDVEACPSLPSSPSPSMLRQKSKSKNKGRDNKQLSCHIGLVNTNLACTRP